MSIPLVRAHTQYTHIYTKKKKKNNYWHINLHQTISIWIIWILCYLQGIKAKWRHIKLSLRKSWQPPLWAPASQRSSSYIILDPCRKLELSLLYLCKTYSNATKAMESSPLFYINNEVKTDARRLDHNVWLDGSTKTRSWPPSFPDCEVAWRKKKKVTDHTVMAAAAIFTLQCLKPNSQIQTVFNQSLKKESTFLWLWSLKTNSLVCKEVFTFIFSIHSLF